MGQHALYPKILSKITSFQVVSIIVAFVYCRFNIIDKLNLSQVVRHI